jgi:hypothetical protein
MYVITVLNTRIEQVHWEVCLNLKIIAYIYITHISYSVFIGFNVNSFSFGIELRRVGRVAQSV